MRKAYVFLLAATLLSGCAFSYRQPVFQGNLLDKEYVDQIKPVESMLTHSLSTFRIVHAAVANLRVVEKPLVPKPAAAVPIPVIGA